MKMGTRLAGALILAFGLACAGDSPPATGTVQAPAEEPAPAPRAPKSRAGTLNPGAPCAPGTPKACANDHVEASCDDGVWTLHPCGGSVKCLRVADFPEALDFDGCYSD